MLFASSVYVFVGEHLALVDFVLCLQRRTLLDNGDYIVISVDDEIYDPHNAHKLPSCKNLFNFSYYTGCTKKYFSTR